MVASSTSKPRILVVGGGSIGQRHGRNLASLGAKVYAVDPNKVIVPGNTPDDIWLQQQFTSLNDALDRPYDGAVVAVPTYLHTKVALPLLQSGLPVLIEKPLAHTVQAAESLAEYRDQIRVGYSMRFHPAIQTIRQYLPSIGQVIHAHAEVGQYLPQWHPTEDYRNWYMAKRELGGGAILDLSHELDYLQWLLGRVRDADAFIGHIDPTLEINSDDCADIRGRMGFGYGVSFTCHMDLIDRSYNRRVRILGEQDTLDWDHQDGYVRLLSDVASLTEYNTDRNIQFVHEAQTFLDWCQGKTSSIMATYDEALHTLQVVESLVADGCYGYGNKK